jgi:glyoxylate carboligase
MAMTIAEVVVESLKNAGVKRVYGLPGDSLNGFTDALRKDGSIEWIHVRNEEVAAFAAGINATSLSGLMKYLASPASLDATVTNESGVVSGVPSQGRYIESGESPSE